MRSVATGNEVTAKVTLVWPAGTIALPETDATDGVSLLVITVRPPAGAGPLMVTVAMDGVLPTTVLGLKLMAVGVGAVTVRAADCVTPPAVALMFAAIFAATGVVLTLKVTLV